MAAQNEFLDIPPGKVAAIVTHLEMLSPAHHRPCASDARLSARRVAQPDPGWYRNLYARVGTDWLWFSRLAMPVTELEAIIHDPAVEVYTLIIDGREEGLLELDFRVEDQCELAFFGLTPANVGSGAGRFLMNEALDLAWAHPIKRFWVHTCTLDHPAALAFYQRSGFVPFRQEIEIADDPRLTGVLPEAAATQVPVYRG